NLACLVNRSIFRSSHLFFVSSPFLSPRYVADTPANAAKRSHFWQISGILVPDQGKRHSLWCDSKEDGQRRTLPHGRKEIIMAGVSNPMEITIVLVHGGFVDGSGWEGVYQLLKMDGYDGSI